MKKYGVAIIGCGHMGLQHISGIYCKDDVEIIGVSDFSLERARKTAERFGNVKYDTDYRKIVDDEKVDIVIIATYTRTHLEIMKYCVEHGKHVLCEKPIAVDFESGKEFIETAKKAKTKVLVAHILRHNKSYIKIKEMIEQGVIGEPKVFRMAQNHCITDKDRFSNLLSDCTPVLDCGVHYLDVARWFTGSDICEVSGTGTKINNTSSKYDYTLMNFKTTSGLVGFFEATWSENVANLNLKEFIGTKGRITLTIAANRGIDKNLGDLIKVYHQDGTVEEINYPSIYKDLYSQFETLVDMIENDFEGDPTLDDVFKAFKAAYMAQEAIETGKIIRL